MTRNFKLAQKIPVVLNGVISAAHYYINVNGETISPPGFSKELGLGASVILRSREKGFPAEAFRAESKKVTGKCFFWGH